LSSVGISSSSSSLEVSSSSSVAISSSSSRSNESSSSSSIGVSSSSSVGISSSSSGSEESSSSSSGLPDLRVDAIYNVDSRLSALKDEEIYSTQDHGTPTYVRNTNCWAYGLDLTCISPWNSSGLYTKAGVMISPRHIACAGHLPIPDGSTIRFIEADGTVVTRTMDTMIIHPDYAPYYPDIAIGVLDSDVPSSITFAKILPQDWRDYVIPYLASGSEYVPWAAGPAEYSLWGIPAVYIDQEEKILVSDAWKLYVPPESVNATLSCTTPLDADRALFYETIISGDSGNPIFIIINDELVLLSVITSAGPVGTNFSYFKDDINTMMTTLGGGYQLTEIDLSGFNPV